MEPTQIDEKIIAFQHKEYTHYDWYKYAYGYKYASIILIDSLLNSTEPYKIDSELLFPIFYNFRHYTELLLKQIVAVYNEKAKTQIIIPKNHRLVSLFEKVKPIINDILFIKLMNPKSRFVSSFTELNVEKLQETINLLNKYDPDSMSFRFPIDPFGKRTLVGSFHVPLKALKKLINETFSSLNHISFAITLAYLEQ